MLHHSGPDSTDGKQAKPESKPKKKRPTDEERFKGIPVKKVYLEPSADERICRKCGT